MPSSPSSILKSASRLVWIAAVASACSSVYVTPAPVPEPLPTGEQGDVRLTLTSGEVVTMYRARLAGDSIVGFEHTRMRENPQRLAVARADVASVAARQFDGGKTLSLLIGITMATLGTFTWLLGQALDSGVSR